MYNSSIPLSGEIFPLLLRQGVLVKQLYGLMIGSCTHLSHNSCRSCLPFFTAFLEFTSSGQRSALSWPFRATHKSSLPASSRAADGARDRQQQFAIEAFGDEEGIIDATSFLKKGTHSVGIARQCFWLSKSWPSATIFSWYTGLRTARAPGEKVSQNIYSMKHWYQWLLEGANFVTHILCQEHSSSILFWLSWC